MAGNVIAFLLIGLTMIPMAKEMLLNPQAASTIIRVAAGLSIPGEGRSASTGGNTPGIGLFDEDRKRIGLKSSTR